jgi:hypothetical protein
LLYDQGFTIHGARNQMQEMGQTHRGLKRNTDASEFDIQAQTTQNGAHLEDEAVSDAEALEAAFAAAMVATAPVKSGVNGGANSGVNGTSTSNFKWQFVRQELNEIRELLNASSQTLQV